MVLCILGAAIVGMNAPDVGSPPTILAFRALFIGEYHFPLTASIAVMTVHVADTLDSFLLSSRIPQLGWSGHRRFLGAHLLLWSTLWQNAHARVHRYLLTYRRAFSRLHAGIGSVHSDEYSRTIPIPRMVHLRAHRHRRCDAVDRTQLCTCSPLCFANDRTDDTFTMLAQ